MQDAFMLTDYCTGNAVPNRGSEANRQSFEKILVDAKGYARDQIRIDVPIEFTVHGEAYASHIDMVITVDGKSAVAVKCCAGAMDSWDREIVTAARILEERPMPWALVTDGSRILFLDAVTGQVLHRDLNAFFTPEELKTAFSKRPPADPLPPDRLEKMRLIYRTYDTMNVNRVF
ncbi:MAG: hypothetical protein CSA22_08245 [Deltaproteobacteria bacterium]|nr:MAG: hypothetical protein CSA22_08245 [Deltaproteobacteria bacterium]